MCIEHKNPELEKYKPVKPETRGTGKNLTLPQQIKVSKMKKLNQCHKLRKAFEFGMPNATEETEEP